MGGIKYYQLAKGEEPPDEFCAVRDIGGEPSEYTFYVPESENAKLRELVVDMLPFAEVGMDDTCVTRRCRLFEQCEDVIGVKCAIEQHMLDRMRELGIEAGE